MNFFWATHTCVGSPFALNREVNNAGFLKFTTGATATNLFTARMEVVIIPLTLPLLYCNAFLKLGNTTQDKGVFLFSHILNEIL